MWCRVKNNNRSKNIIEPISTELSDSTKQYLETLEWANRYFDEMSKSLYIPKEMFGK